MMKPKIVYRNVNAMSVAAFPSMRNTSSVDQIELGCDQKNGSISLNLAATSHSKRNAMSMPTCTLTSHFVLHNFCTGKRRLIFLCTAGASVRLTKMFQDVNAGKTDVLVFTSDLQSLICEWTKRPAFPQLFAHGHAKDRGSISSWRRSVVY